MSVIDYPPEDATRGIIESTIVRYLRLPEERDDCADEVLMALEAAGWRIVPVEPSEAMQVAGAAVWRDHTGQTGRPGDKHPVTAATYRAMIAASVVE